LSIQAVKRKSPNEGGGEEILSFYKNNVKMANELEQTCERLPCVADMRKYTDESKLKEMLDSKDLLCFPLIRWIVMSNRCHISVLPKEKHVKEMDTDYQFVLVSDNPAKEALFRRRRAEIAKKKKNSKGSFYAFHGSALGNWHCILRIGLKNYSNTNKMSTGAAYGQGIYMASTASTSFSYMVPGNTWTKSSIGNGGTMSCIALVEVLDLRGEPNTPIKDHGGTILTCTDETIVTTRYFFIYPQSSNYWSSRGANAVASNLKLPEDIYN